MHAGDGNVHTNIPVNSDDYQMLQTAHEAVKRIMVLARSLDGVISGEHGIGITKLEFLTDEEIAPFAEYKQRIDPQGRFNKGKLLRPSAARGTVDADTSVYADLTNAYALVRADGARVHHHAAVGHRRSPTPSRTACAAASTSRCAPPVPRANLLYSPRNKILATSLLIEAFCTRSRRAAACRSSTGRSSRDVSEHCTVCHKCVNPARVKIDFGDVSMNMRNLLRKMGQKSFRPGNAAAMLMLNAATRRPSRRSAPRWWASPSRRSAWATRCCAVSRTCR